MPTQAGTGGRVSRRSVLRAGAFGAAGIAGAALIGCSGGKPAPDTSSQTSKDSQGSKDKPQRGGTFQTVDVGVIETFDANSGLASTLQFAPYAYSRLLQYEVGDGQNASGKMEGDLVQKWEQPDQLHYILRLRDGVTWDGRAPTNGRALEAEDVVLSWQAYEKTGRFRADVAASVKGGSGGIKAIRAIDKQTVEIELAFPDVIALPAVNWGTNLWIYPKEAWNGGFDPKKEVRGSGPFLMKEHRPGVGYSLERNPKWHHGPEAPWFDAVNVTTIPEPAQWEAQFRVGAIHEGVGEPSNANIPLVAKEVKGTRIVTAPPPGVGGTVSLNWIPNSPFHDVRVRKAVSMSMDRKALTGIFWDPSPYKAVGLDLKTYWFNPLSPAYGEHWLDPQGPNFGPAAKVYQYDAAEARKLLDAAGFTTQKQLQFDITWQPREAYLETMGATLQAMWAKVGIRSALTKPDYTSEWQAFISGGRGYVKWKTGNPMVALKPNSAQPHSLIWLNRNMSDQGSLSVVGDEFPDLAAMIKKARGTFEAKDQTARIHDIQRYMAEQMVAPPFDCQSDSTQIYWGGVRGAERYRAYQGFQNRGFSSEGVAKYFWLEESLRKKS